MKNFENTNKADKTVIKPKYIHLSFRLGVNHLSLNLGFNSMNRNDPLDWFA